MNVFELVKERVPLPEAAAFYGLPPNRSGMIRCPFHEDHHPSMKLNDRYFFCFGCGATGDVVELVSRLLGLDPLSAARRVCFDFGLETGPAKPVHRVPDFLQQERQCILVLRNYLRLLRSWKAQEAPRGPESRFSDRFCEACQMEPVAENLLEDLLFEPEAVQRQTVKLLLPQLAGLEDYIKRKEAEGHEEGLGA